MMTRCGLLVVVTDLISHPLDELAFGQLACGKGNQVRCIHMSADAGDGLTPLGKDNDLDLGEGIAFLFHQSQCDVESQPYRLGGFVGCLARRKRIDDVEV